MKRRLLLAGLFCCLTALPALEAAVTIYTWECQRYGFRLSLPGAWKGYRVIQKETNWDPAGKAFTYYFALPTASRTWNESDAPAGYASLFALTVFSPRQWEVISTAPEAEMILQGASVLAKTNRMVVTWSSGQDCPEDLRERFSEAGDIVKTFALAGGSR